MINSIIIMSVSLLASIIGAICGIGGGIIIKPVLDSLGMMSVNTVNFLAGCTVMSMSGYSVLSAVYKKTLNIKLKTGISVSVGAVAGGILGKQLLGALEQVFHETDRIGAVQAFCLFWLTLAMLIYTLNKKRITTHHMTNPVACVLAGLILGLLSSFLGIGGGPFNLVLLSFLFSMQPKEAAQNSIFIIFFSQLSSLSLVLAERKVPEFNLPVLIGMVIMGILGAMIGRAVNKHIEEATVDQLFQGLNVVILLICIYNFCRLSGVI